jgi:hypothetical protein
MEVAQTIGSERPAMPPELDGANQKNLQCVAMTNDDGVYQNSNP